MRIYTKTEIMEMDYRTELQPMAKGIGIAANQKKDILVAALTAHHAALAEAEAAKAAEDEKNRTVGTVDNWLEFQNSIQDIIGNDPDDLWAMVGEAYPAYTWDLIENGIMDAMEFLEFYGYAAKILTPEIWGTKRFDFDTMAHQMAVALDVPEKEAKALVAIKKRAYEVSEEVKHLQAKAEEEYYAFAKKNLTRRDFTSGKDITLLAKEIAGGYLPPYRFRALKKAIETVRNEMIKAAVAEKKAKEASGRQAPTEEAAKEASETTISEDDELLTSIHRRAPQRYTVPNQDRFFLATPVNDEKELQLLVKWAMSQGKRAYYVFYEGAPQKAWMEAGELQLRGVENFTLITREEAQAIRDGSMTVAAEKSAASPASDSREEVEMPLIDTGKLQNLYLRMGDETIVARFIPGLSGDPEGIKMAMAASLPTNSLYALPRGGHYVVFRTDGTEVGSAVTENDKLRRAEAKRAAK